MWLISFLFTNGFSAAHQIYRNLLSAYLTTSGEGAGYDVIKTDPRGAAQCFLGEGATCRQVVNAALQQLQKKQTNKRKVNWSVSN